MQDLLHSLSPSSFSDLSVLDRQRARFQWRQSFESMDESNDLSCDSLLSVPIELHDLQMDQHPLNELADGTPNLARCFASPLKNKKESASKKRKAGKSHKMDYCDGEEEKQKRTRTGNSPENSKETGAPPPPPKQDFIHVRARRGQATDSHSLAERVSSNPVSCGRNSVLPLSLNLTTTLLQPVNLFKKINQTANPFNKTNLIHLKLDKNSIFMNEARRLQVRRERISERMKYLQGLVPGCNKITGKAGMLDEIINYVQSLQKQVEFLSMKLATANPWIDFNIDSFFPKEVSFACNPSNNLAPAGLSPDVVEPYLQMNPMHQMAACCGLNMNLNVSELELALRRSLGSAASLPDAFFDASFDVDNSSWDANSESISGVDIHQGKGVMLALQSFTGNGPQNNLKMEM